MRKFLRDTFVSALGSLIGIGLLSCLGLITFIGLLIAIFSSQETVKIEDKSVLVFDLSTMILDQQNRASVEDTLLGNLPNSLSLRQVIDGIENAASDDKIVGLFLQANGNYADYGFATLKELRKALEKFKTSGKPIIAYDLNVSENEYYLISIANQLILNPIGLIEMNGLAMPEMFLTGALQKYGIGMQIIKVGNYKSAVEPLTRKNFSPENRLQTQELLNDLWNDLTQTISKSRKSSPQKLNQWVNNQGIINPQEALNNGLVDQIGYYDQALTELRKMTEIKDETDNIPEISLDQYLNLPQTDQKIVDSKNQIALVYAQGEIVDGQGDLNTIGGDSLAQTLREVRNDQTIKAVVLRVNSPGGSVTASDVIWREVALLSKKMPVIVSMGDVAASGGYWISTAGTYIFAEDTTITGSIGVFGILPNLQTISTNNGITWDVVKTGTFADIDTMARPKTPQELKIYQRSVNEVYDLFLDKVAKSRKLNKEKVNQIAQGRVWSGLDGKKIGLVDEIGGLNDAIAYGVKKANLGDDWSLKEYPIPKTLEEEILEQLLGENVKNQLNPMTKEWLKIKEDLSFLQRLNDPKGIYAILPYDFRVE